MVLPVGWFRKLMPCGALFGFALANWAAAPSVLAQDNAPPSATASQPTNLSADQLQKLVAKIALYPDDLLAICLPASTQPVQIVQAHRFLEQRKSNPSAEPPKSWDPSVVALLNYPEVISLMNSDLTWTEQLGNAVINQQEDVMDAIQSFRQKVYAAGNLKTNDKQKVEVQQGPPLTETTQGGGEAPAPGPTHQTIIIQSASPDVVSVPSYDPATVVEPIVAGAPYPYSYSAPYPYYWAPGAAFFTGAVFGAAVGYGLSWANGGIYSGDVNINNNFNSNRISNGNLSRNPENRWRADRGQRGNRGRQGNRPTQKSIKSGLAQRSGGQAAGNRGQGGLGQRAGGGRVSQRPSTGGRGQGAAAGRGRGGGAGLGPSAGGGRSTPRAAERPGGAGGRGGAGGFGGGVGGTNFGGNRGGGLGGANFGGYRGSGAFSGAGNGFATNRASFRGNQSMGRSQFMGNRSYGGGNRSFGGARGGGGFRGGGGGGRRGGGGGRRR